MTAPHRCCICGTLVHRERGEREEIWRSRKACSLPCRAEMRSRTQLAKAEERLARAVRTWTPDSATSSHAQLHGIKHGRFREALVEAGHTLPSGRERTRDEEPSKKRRQDEPPVDRLLNRLVQVYGARRAPIAADPARRRAA